MPKVGIDNEPLHERLVFAYDGDDYRVVACDTDGNLVAAVLADQDVQARSHGWIGSAWQKNPLSFGVSGVVADAVSDLSLAATEDTLNGNTVDPGELWVITQVNVRYDGTVPTSVAIELVHDGGAFPVFYQGSPASTRWYYNQGWWVLDAGDYMRTKVYGSTLNDDLYQRIIGFRIDIDQ